MEDKTMEKFKQFVETSTKNNIIDGEKCFAYTYDLAKKFDFVMDLLAYGSEFEDLVRKSAKSILETMEAIEKTCNIKISNEIKNAIKEVIDTGSEASLYFAEAVLHDEIKKILKNSK